MPLAPKAVQETYERMKEQSDAFLALKNIGRNYYVYKQTGKWDKDKKKTKIIVEYLGKITKDGTFVKKLASIKDDLEKAQAVIARHGGEVVWRNREQIVHNNSELANEETTGKNDERILKILSMNGRASVPLIAKITGMSNSAAEYRVKKLEEKYGIRYLSQVYTSKLGYADFIIFVKFEGEVPSVEEMRKELTKFPRVQLAMTVHGKYDLVVYFVAESNYLPEKYYEWAAHGALYEFQLNAFKAYNARWYMSPFYKTYGYVPLRDEFFDVLERKMWKRSNVNSKPAPGQLRTREFDVLRELNRDGKCEFTEIDKKYGFDKGRSDYTYNKMVENKTISRITMAMQKPPVKYVAIIYMDFVNMDAFAKSRPDILANITEERTQIDKYALVGDVTSPYGGVFVFPVTHEEELEKVVAQLKNIRGTSSYVMIASETIVGSLCYRLFDTAYSSQQRILIEEYKKTLVTNKVNYFDSKKARNKTVRRDIRGIPLEDT